MGYRRFIAYVYEYRKGKKEDNCGFVKVEVRNHMCAIEPHLQVGNLAAGEVCKVYGFVRKEGLMNGILLGSCKTEANRIECLVETDGMDMGGSGIPLEKMGGMILLTESGGFFGTEWDDQTIRPENFKESIIKKEETGTVCEIIKEKAEEKLENEGKPYNILVDAEDSAGCIKGVYELDCCMVDATVADMIIQYAIFDDIIYG